MKVYAEYFSESNGNEYRKKTLLHFGQSTNLIGSAVLMNPGSAKPSGAPDSEFIKLFYERNHEIKHLDTVNWKTFNPDSTMVQLEKIFSGWYLGEKYELNGVIQLFNCFYFKNQNFGEAIKNYTKESNYNFNEFQFFLDKPVYFGWGEPGKYGDLRTIATEIFKNYELKKTPIYDPNFDKNSFYHPGYVNRSYSRMAKTQRILRDFYNLIRQ